MSGGGAGELLGVAVTLQRVQMHFAQPNALRRHFDAFVVGDELESVFEKMYKIICGELTTNSKHVDDFKEIFIFTLKSVYSLLLNNRIRPVELIRKNFESLHGLSKSQNRTLLDLFILNLNDDIAETIKASDNPWIESVWEELIEYLTRLFNDYFPDEASSQADRKRRLEVAGTEKPAGRLFRLRLREFHKLPPDGLQVPLHRQPHEVDPNHLQVNAPDHQSEVKRAKMSCSC